ncbi:MAG: hypothetical protein DRP73_00500 [Candidatus Omnitrophota bacterium]|nr:MAG: hypothetical protein DRP73_00500 [Candidatus Omnitrophota bacterium]
MIKRNIFVKIKNDPVLLKIVKFFHENPSCIDSAENISKWIGEELKTVRKKLDYLVKKKVINKDKTYLAEAYSYTQDKELM